MRFQKAACWVRCNSAQQRALSWSVIQNASAALQSSPRMTSNSRRLHLTEGQSRSINWICHSLQVQDADFL